MVQNKQNKRLLSLDVLRGMTVACMILVNNTGTFGYNYTLLRHASWNGLNLADLVFPMFMFLMGVSTYISLRKYSNQDKQVIKKIVRRSIVLVLIGVFINLFTLFLEQGNKLELGELRWMGVMQRLGICYGVTAVLSLYIPHKNFLRIAIVILIGYFLIQLVGNGFEKTPDNIIGLVDQTILGKNHMYLQGKQMIDPEGILSTIPAIAQVMIGFVCGKYIIEKNNEEQQLLLYFLGTALLFSGFLFSYACPINKRLWSSTFVLVTCGVAALSFAALINILDVRRFTKWASFFEVFGANPLVLYVAASILAPLIKSFDLHKALFNSVLKPLFGNYFGSFMYGIIFLLFLWIVGFLLLKKRIYIKI